MGDPRQDLAWLHNVLPDQSGYTLLRWLGTYTRLGDTRCANAVAAEMNRRATGAPLEDDATPPRIGPPPVSGVE